MAGKPHDPLSLDFTSEALSDLDAIWDWNAATYGNAHADRYIEFLQRQTDRLRSNFQGRPVPTRPDFNYATIRRRSRGHGHVVVYEIVENRILVRMGGCYTNANAPLLSVSGVPQISMTRNEADLLCLSFDLCNRDGVTVAKMEDNAFTVRPGNVYDMTVKAKLKDVKIWLDKEDVGLELSFKRIKEDKLRAMLKDDRRRSLAIVEECDRKRFAQLPPQARSDWQEALGATRMGYDVQNEDVNEMKVMAWVKENCEMDDEMIPILNFEQMAIHFHGHRITIKDGMGDMFFYSTALPTQNGWNLKCPCAQCVDTPASV